MINEPVVEPLLIESLEVCMHFSDQLVFIDRVPLETVHQGTVSKLVVPAVVEESSKKPPWKVGVATEPPLSIAAFSAREDTTGQY